MRPLFLSLLICLAGVSSLQGQDIPLQPNEPTVGQVAGVQGAGGSVLSATQYTLVVPPGATEAVFNLIAVPANLDIDLEVRLGQRVAIGQSGILSDYFSETVGSGSETVVVTAESEPPLQAETYYVGIVNYEMLAVTFFLTASYDTEQATGSPTLTPTATLAPPSSTPTPTSTQAVVPTATQTQPPTVTPTRTATEIPSVDPTVAFLERADLDGSGTIDEADLLLFLQIWKAEVPEP